MTLFLFGLFFVLLLFELPVADWWRQTVRIGARG